jgi:hypothetical protein
MDKGKIDIDQVKKTHIERAQVVASMAGPKQLNIDRRSQEPDAKPYNAGKTTNLPYAKWGADNKYPQQVVNLNVQDTTSAACLNFKIKAHYGKGIFLYKNEVDEYGHEQKVPLNLSDYPEIEEFFILSEIENHQQSIISDFEWWNWYVTEFIFSENRKKVLYANRIPAINCRLQLHNDRGISQKIYVSGEFNGDKQPMEPESIDLISLKSWMIDKKRPAKAVFVAKQTSVDRQYYPLPMWHSNNKFLNLSLEISDWILSNINNSINVKYHIQYPQGYFEAICPRTAYETDADQLAAIKSEKQKLFSEIDECLSGTSNVGKYIHTWTRKDPLDPSKDVEFKITPIKNETNHEAYLPAFDTSAAAIANAHNAPLDLVGLSLSKGMGSGSGSNIRESFNFYMQLHTEVPRQTTLEWLYLVKKINDWPKDVHFGYRNIVFQSVNENKAGYAVENEANPTSDQK